MSDGSAQKQVPRFAALAQATRLHILACVAEAGPKGLPAGVIARAVRCPASTLSFHLKELSRTGLLESRARGRFMIYALRRETVEELAGYLAGLVGEGSAKKPRKAATRSQKPARGADRQQMSMFGD